jgi:hypothetical protein
MPEKQLIAAICEHAGIADNAAATVEIREFMSFIHDRERQPKLLRKRFTYTNGIAAIEEK